MCTDGFGLYPDVSTTAYFRQHARVRFWTNLVHRSTFTHGGGGHGNDTWHAHGNKLIEIRVSRHLSRSANLYLKPEEPLQLQHVTIQ